MHFKACSHPPQRFRQSMPTPIYVCRLTYAVATSGQPYAGPGQALVRRARGVGYDNPANVSAHTIALMNCHLLHNPNAFPCLQLPFSSATENPTLTHRLHPLQPATASFPPFLSSSSNCCPVTIYPLFSPQRHPLYHIPLFSS